MVEWHESQSTYAIKKAALSYSLPLQPMYSGMAWVPFHLGNKEGGIVMLPFTTINVWWNGMSPIPLKLDLNGSV